MKFTVAAVFLFAAMVSSLANSVVSSVDEEDNQQVVVSEQMTEDSVTIRGNREHRRGMRARRPWKQYNMTQVKEGDDELPPCWKVRKAMKKNRRMNATLDEPMTSSPEAEITTVPTHADQPCRPGRGNHHRYHHHRHHHHHHRHHNKIINEEDEPGNLADTEEQSQTIDMENRRLRNPSHQNERYKSSSISLIDEKNYQPTAYTGNTKYGEIPPHLHQFLPDSPCGGGMDQLRERILKEMHRRGLLKPLVA